MGVIIKKTGCYVPDLAIKNEKFLQTSFLDEEGNPFLKKNQEIIEKFSSITGIKERRYADINHNTSDLATMAAIKALESDEKEKESIDYIIFAHNFGDTDFGSKQSGLMPSLASKVKANLNIKNPNCVAYDLIFGCPGWLEGVIQAYNFILAGAAKKCLVIGAETLSRVVDNFDRDSMIFSDGAGAVIIEKTNSENGVIAYKSVTYTDNNEVNILNFDSSYNPTDTHKYIKMKGRKVYEFALKKVPDAIKKCIDEANLDIEEIKKVFIHQANMKMDEAIVKRLFKLYNKELPENILPMNIESLGNSSVATIPTLFDQVLRNEIVDHKLYKNDIIIFASVGAGMNVNSVIYKI
tara:strand:+ start:5576 stop:6631 length:1056 start_codon:yes stop_codon:yes gene_type:complete